MKKAMILATGMFACAAPLFAQEAPKVDFKTQILPILEAKCIECHNETKQKSGLRMDTREHLLKGGSEGPAIVEGKSAESMLVKLVEGTHPDYERMPPKSDPLPVEQIALLKAWIDQGAPWPAEVKAAQFPATGQAEGLPADWVVEATAQGSALAKWGVSADLKGPSDATAITVVPEKETKPETINLLYTAKKPLKDGSVEVQIKHLAGSQSGAGIIWRVKDKNNYYFARFAANRLTIDKVVEGKTIEIAGLDYAPAAPDAWLALKIEQHGNKIVASVDSQTVEAADDTFADAGGVGYATVGDASAAFAGAKLTPAA